jgi:hypothetical protein
VQYILYDKVYDATSLTVPTWAMPRTAHSRTRTACYALTFDTSRVYMSKRKAS